MTDYSGGGLALQSLMAKKLLSMGILWSSFINSTPLEKQPIFAMDTLTPTRIISQILSLPYLTKLSMLSKILSILRILQKTTLCLSAMGNPIPMLWISNFLNKKEPKPLIYIIARQHPG